MRQRKRRKERKKPLKGLETDKRSGHCQGRLGRGGSDEAGVHGEYLEDIDIPECNEEF